MPFREANTIKYSAYFLSFYVTPYSQELAIGSYPKPHKSIPRPQIQLHPSRSSSYSLGLSLPGNMLTNNMIFSSYFLHPIQMCLWNKYVLVYVIGIHPTGIWCL